MQFEIYKLKWFVSFTSEIPNFIIEIPAISLGICACSSPSKHRKWSNCVIIGDMAQYVFINVACYSAFALLPNGKNAHINVNDQHWWAEKILKLKKKYIGIKIICVCSLKENGKRILFPLQFDDKIINYDL